MSATIKTKDGFSPIAIEVEHRNDEQGERWTTRETVLSATVQVVRITREVIYEGEAPVTKDGRVDLNGIIPTDEVAEYAVDITAEIEPKRYVSVQRDFDVTAD